jgi:adenylate cyclase
VADEIERKFLVEELPPDLEDEEPPEEIRQAYLALTPDGVEVRVRQRADRYYLTVKSAGGLVREETEIELSRDQFARLWELPGLPIVEKTRRQVPRDQHVMEIDVFAGRLEGLVLAEVEFESVAASEAFVPPSWLGQEVTEDSRYKNRSLALNGPPR